MNNTIYFFAGQLFVQGRFESFINGTIEDNVFTREDSLNLLKNINELIISQVKNKYLLKKIDYQITNVSIIGEVAANDKGEH